MGALMVFPATARKGFSFFQAFGPRAVLHSVAELADWLSQHG